MTTSSIAKTENSDTSPGRQVEGVLAEFAQLAELRHAIQVFRSAGYQQLDAHTPYPVHGLERELGMRGTRLAWLVLVAGVVGGLGALLLQWWTNAVDYPFLISGKPRFSLPANIPVVFEVVILSSAVTALAVMLLRNGLPAWSNPRLRSERFRRATDDGLFLWVDAKDPRFSLSDVLGRLDEVTTENVEILDVDTTPSNFPRALLLGGAIAFTLALLPPVLIARARNTTSDKPRLHNFFDMDFQPKFKAQTESTLFADHRAMRPPVPGTVARGQLEDDEAFYRGTVANTAPQDPSSVPAATDTMPASTSASTSASSVVASGAEANEWVREIPLPITSAAMERGQQRFNIYCAACHGQTGDGNGIVAIRARELEQSTWVPPTSLHLDYVREQPAGQLFNTITNGIRKMPGYKYQISPEDRWSIVMYVQALQRSQNTSVEDVPADLRPTLREIQ